MHVRTNTIRHKGRIFRILHTCNSGTSFTSAIIATDTHAERILEVIAGGGDIAHHYDMLPSSIPEGGIVHETCEIRDRGDGSLVGYWDFPLLDVPSAPDMEALGLLEGLMVVVEQMSAADVAETVEARCGEIIEAEGDTDRLGEIFGIDPTPKADGRFGWIKEEYGKKSGWCMDTDYPELEQSFFAGHSENTKKKGPSEAELEEEKVIKNPALQEYYANPITDEELAGSSCSRPPERTGFAARLGRRMMKKGFMRHGKNDPCYTLPKKDEPKPVFRSKLSRRVARRPFKPEEAAAPSEAPEIRADAAPSPAPKPLASVPVAARKSKLCRMIRRPMFAVPALISSYSAAKPVFPASLCMPIGPPGGRPSSASLSGEYG